MLHDGLIFDLDGTLWDSTVPVAQAWTDAVRLLKVPSNPITPKSVAGIMGMPHDEILQTFFPESSIEVREKIAETCYDEEVSLLRREGAYLYPGVREGLAELAKHFPLFIVSNCQSPYLDAFFEWTKLSALFKDHECHGNTGLTKGNNISMLVKRNGLTTPAYIGDTSGDERAAREAGLAYFHVEYGFGRPISDCRRFTDFAQLVDFFLPA